VASSAWHPANNGAGKRIWFVSRDAKEIRDRYHFSTNGRLIRYGSHTSALAVAERLNGGR